MRGIIFILCFVKLFVPRLLRIESTIKERNCTVEEHLCAKQLNSFVISVLISKLTYETSRFMNVHRNGMIKWRFESSSSASFV